VPLFAGYVNTTVPMYGSQASSGTGPSSPTHYTQVTLAGTMFQAGFGEITPYFALNQETTAGVVDAGVLITMALNGVQGRRWGTCAPATTNINIAIDGSFQSALEYVQDVLGQCVSKDGTTQWTIDCNPSNQVPVLQLKDVATQNWTIDAGAPGVDVSGLVNDLSLMTNVLYGSGTTAAGVTTPYNMVLSGIATGFDPGGQYFANTQYQDFSSTTGSAYPFANTATTMVIGTSDGAPGMTVNPTGVTTLQQTLAAQGYLFSDGVTGTYDAETAGAVEFLQATAGLSPTGDTDLATWNSIFSTGTTTGNGAVVLPLYSLSEVQQWLYNSQGVTSTPNPAYNPAIMRVESYIGMGSGLTLAQAKSLAKAVVLRDSKTTAWAGTIVLTSDPHENSRFAMRAGQNVMVNFLYGQNVLMHINQVDVSLDSAPTSSGPAPSSSPSMSVTLTVDTAARDAITTKALVNHEPGAKGDLVKRSDVLKRKSRMTNDTVAQFDAASGAGIVARLPLTASTWTALRIPFAQMGNIKQTLFQTDTPASPFYIAIFNKQVTAPDIISLLGNNGNPGIANIWQTKAVALKQAGWEITFGGTTTTTNGVIVTTISNPCGYYPSSLPQGGSVTGNFVDDDLWSYASQQPPFLWACLWAPNSCHIQGRFIPAIGGTPA
jgi:hypothetical protein